MEGTLTANVATTSARHQKKHEKTVSSIGMVSVLGHVATRIGVTLTARDPVLFAFLILSLFETFYHAF